MVLTLFRTLWSPQLHELPAVFQIGFHGFGMQMLGSQPQLSTMFSSFHAFYRSWRSGSELYEHELYRIQLLCCTAMEKYPRYAARLGRKLFASAFLFPWPIAQRHNVFPSQLLSQLCIAIDYRCDSMNFWLSAHNCQIPTPTSQNLEIEQQIRIFVAD
jgi:hypothetical protein